MSPELVWHRLLTCLLAGALLGPGTDALRPLRRRLPLLTQLLLAGQLLACWLFTSFGLCRGDLRPGYWLASLAGLGLWEWLLGPDVSGFFSLFWQIAVISLNLTRKFFLKKKKIPLCKTEKMEYNRRQ